MPGWLLVQQALFRQMLLLPLGREKGTHPVWVHVSLFPETPKKGKEQAHILEFRCLCLSVLRLNILLSGVLQHSLMLGCGRFAFP